MYFSQLSYSQNVGINTTTPQKSLHINALNDSLQIDNLNGNGNILGISTDGKVFRTDTINFASKSDSSNFSYELIDKDRDTRIFVEKNPDEDNIRFDTRGSQKMIIDSNGYVGIGLGAPTSKLHVRANPGENDVFTLTRGVTNIFDIIRTGQIGIGQNITTSNPYDIVFNLQSIAPASGNTNDIYYVNAGGNPPIRNIFGNSGVNFGTFEYANGASALEKKFYYTINSTTDTILTIAGNNRVGIGTYSPNATLHVTSPSNPEVRIVENNNPTSYLSLKDPQTGLAQIEKRSPNNSSIDISAIPRDSISDASIRLFRQTVTSGNAEFEILKGNGTNIQNTVLRGNGYSFIAGDTGNLTIGNKFDYGAKTNIYGPILADTVNGFSHLLRLYNNQTVANNNYLDFKTIRHIAGTNWNGTSSRIQRTVDNTPMGFIDFGISGLSPSYGLAFGNEDSTQMVIGRFGNVGIGTITPTEKLQVEGNVAPVSDNTHSLGTNTLRWSEIYATNGTINTSDKRLKTNINKINYGIETIKKLNPITFNWKENDNGIRLGFLAQELKLIVPEIITEAKNNDKTLGVRYNELIPILTKAIQEQQLIIEQQQQSINKLVNENKQLKESSVNKKEMYSTNEKLQELENELKNIQLLLKENL